MIWGSYLNRSMLDMSRTSAIFSFLPNASLTADRKKILYFSAIANPRLFTHILDMLMTISLRCGTSSLYSRQELGFLFSIPFRASYWNHHHSSLALRGKHRKRISVYEKTRKRYHEWTETYFTFIKPNRIFIWGSCRHYLEGMEGGSGWVLEKESRLGVW